MSRLTNFFDENQKVKIWPKKHAMKREVVMYIASKFEITKKYTEKEVNEVINQWHTFDDYFLLRRSLIDYKFLSRTKDGAQYWKNNLDEENLKENNITDLRRN